MGEQVAEPLRKFASSRICKVSGFSTELVEFHSEEPVLHILFIPGNPGIVSFYKKFIEAMYENFEGRASITGIGHVSHTKKTCVTRRTFSLQDQINHKVDFIKQELQDTKIPVIMVGHSIGSYICLEILKISPLQGVKLTVALYPFLTRNKGSFKQDFIGFISRSSILSAAVSTLSYSLGLLPTRVKSFLVRRSLGPSWTSSAVDIIATNLLEYQTMRSILFMTLTEFEELAEDPDWSFIRSKQGEIAILFGDDDHWGPLTLLEEISKQAPDVHLAVEKEGHTHAFCCTDAGSVWVADHVASLIKIRILSAET
ncbi:alpha/beta-Hydrolases superfamily protein isoform X1 [Wolffia australiana]